MNPNNSSIQRVQNPYRSSTSNNNNGGNGNGNNTGGATFVTAGSPDPFLALPYPVKFPNVYCDNSLVTMEYFATLYRQPENFGMADNHFLWSERSRPKTAHQYRTVGNSRAMWAMHMEDNSATCVCNYCMFKEGYFSYENVLAAMKASWMADAHHFRLTSDYLSWLCLDIADSGSTNKGVALTHDDITQLDLHIGHQYVGLYVIPFAYEFFRSFIRYTLPVMLSNTGRLESIGERPLQTYCRFLALSNGSAVVGHIGRMPTHSASSTASATAARARAPSAARTMPHGTGRAHARSSTGTVAGSTAIVVVTPEKAGKKRNADNISINSYCARKAPVGNYCKGCEGADSVLVPKGYGSVKEADPNKFWVYNTSHENKDNMQKALLAALACLKARQATFDMNDKDPIAINLNFYFAHPQAHYVYCYKTG